MKKIIPFLMALLLLAGCGAQSEESTYRQVNAEEAATMMEEESGYIILDVRTAQEYSEKHIPGAINIPNETIGCTGMTHSAAMASEILPGKTILEALNTDLVCDAINTAMRELFLQIVYGRSQSAFSEGGLVIGAGLEDLGKGLRSQTGTLYGTVAKGTRYLELTEGYITKQFLDKDSQVCGYEYVHLGKMMEAIKAGMDANEAVQKFTGRYGRTTAEQGVVKSIDPRKE